MKENVIITFDYEVFLGQKTGTIENSVIKPTKKILEVLKQNYAKAIFFVDATWLLFLRENFPNDLLIVADQLRDIIKTGSTVELHLHPIWIHAYRSDDRIAFSSFNNYKLQSLNNREIHHLFKQSIDLLESITNQKVRCFRAGGFCIEPFDEIRNVFDKFELKYDFSVAPGVLLNEGEGYDFNFSTAPRIRFYKFQDDVNKPDENGHYIEIPLSTYIDNPVYRLINKLLGLLKRDNIYGDGISFRVKSFFSSSSLLRRLKFSYSILTIDKTNNLFFKYLLKIHFRNSDSLVIISHPKTISKEALRNLSYVTKKFNTINSFDLEKFLVG